MASPRSKKPSKKPGTAGAELHAPEVPAVRAALAAEPAPTPRFVAHATLDEILALQLLVAWAGEAMSDPPRLGWWRTSLADEFGGEDLFRRLTPRTWRWAVLEAARIAARGVDADARSHAADGDQLRTLFHFGFEVDEQLDDRLAELKRAVPDPVEILPMLAETGRPWEASQFLSRLTALTPVPVVAASSVGRRIKAGRPDDLAMAARMLAAAMAPITERYPAPHFKSEDE